MPSSYSSSLRFELQATGEGVNIWGDRNNSVHSRVDYSIAGFLTKALTGDYTLTTANGLADEARVAMLKFTGTGVFTVTIPSVSKRYDVLNGCTGDLTLTNGSASLVVKAGEAVSVITDGGSVLKLVQPADFRGARITSVGTPTSGTDAATKAYVDATAFSMAAGSLPGQAGNAGKFLATDGATAGWAAALSSASGMASATGGVVTVTAADVGQIRAGATTDKPMAPGLVYNAFAEVTLTDAATIAVDMSTFLNAVVTLGGNRTLGNPTNPKVGQTGWIRAVQPATGGPYTLAMGTSWKRPGGATTLSTAANANDLIEYQVITPTFILYNVIRNPT